MEWHVEIVEGFDGGNAKVNEMSAGELSAALGRLAAEGWTIRHVLTNGLNRWTVVCSRGTD